MKELTLEMILTPSDIPMRGIITPNVARALMALNEGNRTLSSKAIEVIQRQMEQANFRYTGDAIRISTENKLIDGQHRLVAAINADQSIDCVVVNNLPPDVMSVIDTGRKRSASDQLRLKGVLNASNVVSAINTVFALAARRQAMKATTPEIEQFMHNHPGVERSVVLVQHGLSRDRCGLPAMLATLHFIGHDVLDLPETADAFVNAFATGQQTYPNDAAIFHRELCLTSRRTRRFSLEHAEMRASLITAWNCFRQKKPMPRLWRDHTHTVEVDGFDPAAVGLAHIRNRTPMSVTPFLTEADKEIARKATRRGKQRAKGIESGADRPGFDLIAKAASPEAEPVVIPSTVRLRKRPVPAQA
ncbi:MAG: hypothetical protein EOP83_03965 [Verrucomicrobiaceae bacterium]|nr:MAG: hypothetical protein EOP83_03965 [Verrucomicrobiaceae bacterium]